jgi:hypothetical protein
MVCSSLGSYPATMAGRVDVCWPALKNQYPAAIASYAGISDVVESVYTSDKPQYKCQSVDCVRPLLMGLSRFPD